MIASYTYGVYGELLSGDTGFTRFLYNGRCGVATDGNGLYYMRQRYYNPEIKRFVNQDVLTGSISNSQSLNRYSYVQGNPVSYTDPFGLSPTNGLFTGTTFAHCLFAVLGCIPGPVGVAANLADALIYALVDHDYLMTGVSLLGELTLGAGGIAGMAVKGSKLARGAKGVQFASGFLASGIMFAKNADNAAQVGRGLFDKYAVRKEPFSQKTLQELSALNLALAGCGMSAYGMAGNGQALAKVLKEAQVTSRLKNLCQTHALNNGGSVDLDALADAFKANGAKAGGGGKKGGNTATNIFPENPDDLLPEITRDKVTKSNGTTSQTIYPSDNIRIRAEQHPLLQGETYNPRHHGVHYHVEYRIDSSKSWNNKNNVNKLYPNGYIPGSGTGFIPGETFPE